MFGTVSVRERKRVFFQCIIKSLLLLRVIYFWDIFLADQYFIGFFEKGEAKNVYVIKLFLLFLSIIILIYFHKNERYSYVRKRTVIISLYEYLTL